MKPSDLIFDTEYLTPAEVFDRAERARLVMLSRVPDNMTKLFRDKAAKMVKTTEGRGGPIMVVVTRRYGEEQ